MRRDQFEHVIAAAANVIGEDEFVVIGSQAILGLLAEPPEELLQSMEADIYPLRDPGLADAVEGVLGDGSAFEQQFGYYAHAVGPETAKAPAGWMDRLVRVEIPPRLGSDRRLVAWCLEVHDLVLAKLARGSARDWDYGRTAVRSSIVDIDVCISRVSTLPVSDEHRATITTRLHAMRGAVD